MVALAAAAAVLLGITLSRASGDPGDVDPVDGEGLRALAVPAAPPLRPPADLRPDPPAPRPPKIHWRDSVAVGLPYAGRLVRGVRVPAEGRVFFTWDPILKRSPNRSWRRWGTDELVRTTLRVIRAFALDNPGAPRVAIGDMSRPRGGDFGKRYGGIGHASHQNGLDADVYYPRLDRHERAPLRPRQVDLALAQDLVDRFVAAGAQKVFVGPRLDLHGPPGIVQPLVNHDNHLHVRLRG